MIKEHAVLFLILLFSSLINYSGLSTGHDWGGDFSSYIMQSRSISEGSMQSFMEDNTFTVLESSDTIGPTAYPWGFPLLLAPIIHFFGLDLIILKTINIIFFVLFLLCAFALFSQRLSRKESVLIVMLLAFNPTLLTFHNNILPDIPFLFFSTLSILLIDRILFTGSAIPVSATKYTFLGLSIFGAYFTRMNGLLFLPALLVCQVARSTRRDAWERINPYKAFALHSIPYLVFLIFLIPSALVFPSGASSYSTSLKMVTLESIIGNVDYYFRIPFTFFQGTPFPVIIYVATLPFVLIGLIINLRKDFHIIIYSSLTLILYILWPFQQGIRFILPIILFYIYFVFQGVRWSLQHVQQYSKLAHVSNVVFWCVIIALFLRLSIATAGENLSQDRKTAGPFDQASTEMFDFVKNHTADNSTIIFFKPRVMRMLTGRSSIMINTCADLSEGDYYIYHKEMGSRYQVLLENVETCYTPIKIEPVFDNDKFTVNKIAKGIL